MFLVIFGCYGILNTIMYVLKSFFKRNNETLLKSIECLSLAWLYYHAN